MSKTKIKTNSVSGFRIAVMIISILLLSLIMAFSMLLGISSLKHHGPVQLGEDATTVRKRLPVDGTLPDPVKTTPLDNIGYMAYVLDNQPFYHVKAYNSTKSTGYEQVTQSWKDYKNAELSGADLGVMVCSDLSYSALVKSSSQSCFIGSNEALIRGGNKPGKNSQPLDIEWSAGKPTVYDKEGYKYAYGEFSTEISVYVINEDTLSGADDVVDNGDGTYSQKYYLNENAGCWYQYGMKTRGGLKKFPAYKRIEITFTFDSKWQVLETYCEEKATISPRALGGMDMPSDSKTTTAFDYSEEGFDNEHYAYFDDFFKQYQGSSPDDNNDPVKEDPGVLDVLGGGFSKVVGESGQQFKLAIKLGDTEYDGKVFLHLPDMGDILGTLDARVALEKKDSGKQDFYAEFKNGAVNVYYSTDFALTADIDEISQSVNKIIGWVKEINSDSSAQPAAARYARAAEEETGSGLDLGSLVNDLKLEIGDTEATVSLQSENLLGLGLGIDVVIGFDRTVEEDGDIFAVKNLGLNYINYKGTPVDLKADIVPDDGEVITRQASSTPANLADYAESVYRILSSNTIKVDIGLADKLIEGLTLDASAYLSIGSDIAANVEISALYKGISLKLDASYIYDKTSYGKIYLHVSEINGKAVDAKVYCDIGDTVNSVKNIISLFNGTNGNNGNSGDSGVQAQAAENELANIINKVLNLNLSKIIGKVSGDSDAISLEINADELLKGLDVSLGFNFGTVLLKVDNANTAVSGSVSALGLSLDITGSEKDLPLIGNAENYVDINAYVDSVYALLQKPSYDIAVALKGTKLTDKIDLSALEVNGTATVAIESGNIRVKLPVTVKYGDCSVSLTAYYTISLSDGSYGKIYLNVTSITVADKETALDAKVYCDIRDAVDGVKEIVAKFTTKEDNGVAVASEQASIISKVIETLLKLDYNEIITATNEKLTVKLDVDEILTGLEISLGGIQFGELNLGFETATGSLSGSLEKLGLTVGVNGNDTALGEFVLSNYVDLGIYLDSVNALLGKPSYDIKVSLNGTKLTDKIDLSTLVVNGTATVAIESGNIRVKLPVTVVYDNYGVELTAYYSINLSDGSYGKIYLGVSSVTIAGKQTALDAKVYCDIKDSVDGVKEIIEKFTPKEDDGVAVASEQASIISKVIETLLKLDYNEMITATNEKLTVKLNVDEILTGLEISLGGIRFGELNLEYATATGTLDGSLEQLGLTVNISGNDTALGEFVLSNYVDLGIYLDSVKALLDKNSYDIELSFTGNNYIKEKIDLTGLKLDVKAQVAFTENYGGARVNITKLNVAYKEVSLSLSARYEIDFNGSYGTVYLDISKVNGVEVKGVKVRLNITDAVNGVKNIINAFKAPEIQTYAAETVDTVGKIVNGVLKLNFNELLTVTDEKAELTLDLDKLLSEFDLGFNLGTVKLEYTPADFTLTGSDTAIGLNLIKLSGKDEELGSFTAEGYIDLNEFISGVEGIVDSEIYEIGVGFTGGVITDKIDLTGLSLSATAYAKVENGYNDITVRVPMLISYCGIEVELSAYYKADIAAKDYATVYLELTRIDKTILNAKVYCDIQDAIGAVRDIINAFTPSDSKQSRETTDPATGTADIISKVVGIVLNLDYPEIIKGSKDNLSVTIDVDDILSAFGVDLGEISLGDLKLDLTLDKDRKAQLSGSLETLGVTMSLKGNDSYVMPAAPVNGEYLDLTAVLRLAEDMINESKAIANAKDIAFSIDANAVIDGAQVVINGSGEIIWVKNSVKVAVTLSVSVDTETLEINFVYDETVAAEDPFVIITINEAGVKITRSEIDKLVNSFKGLIDAFKKEEAPKEDTTVAAPDASGYAIAVGGKTLDEILKNDNVKTVLNAILGFISEFTVKIDTVSAEDAPEVIYNLILKHSDGMELRLGADGCLSLTFAKTGVFKLDTSVEAGSGVTVADIRKDLTLNEKTEQNADGKYKYYELSEFVNKLYGSMFDKLEEVSLKKLLGDNPYLVTLNLSGVNSGISALEAVSVNAELYYDEGVDGTQRATKLMQVNLSLDINGTEVLASASYKGRTLYIKLDKIGATALTGICFRTDVQNIFDAAEQLVRLITDTNLVEMLNRINGKGAPATGDIENISAFAELNDENGNAAPSALTKLLDAVLSLNLEQSFKFDKDSNTATINIDGISEAMLGVKIGTVTATLNEKEKTLSASIGLDGSKEWFRLNAAPCERRTNAINPDEYMDIGFVSTLLSDLVDTITNDSKQIYGLYSFTGSIAVDVNDIPVLGSLKIRFNNATLSAGFDGNNKFYLTLAASMQKTSAIGFTVTENRDISITYCDGLIVLGRDIGTNKEIYKVLTLEYLLDNLLDKNNSPARWLLGTNSTVWGLLVDNLKVNIDSGLTKPKTYTLYEQLQQTVKEEKFNLADYLSGMTVKTGNAEPVSVYGEGATLATEKFSLKDDVNHYAFDLNGLTMKKLTGGAVTAMCAVVTRNNDGLSGIKAYGEIGSMVNFTLDFGTYLEGVTEVYGGKTFNLVETTVTADTFYNDYAEAKGVNKDNFSAETYYKYDGDNEEYAVATEFEEGVTYFEKVNTAHYIKDGESAYLATEFVEGTKYYVYVETDSTKKLGTVAVRNYLDYVTKTYGFDRDHEFTDDKTHIDPIFGCFNSEDGTYVSSDILETIYFDVYADATAAKPERTLEVLYGSTVKLVRDFPEFADENKTQKLVYVIFDSEGNEIKLPQEVVVTDDTSVENRVAITYVDGKGRVSIYKSSAVAVAVEFNFVGVSGMKPMSAAFSVGDKLAAYELNDYSFLGWFKDADLIIPVANSKVNKGDIENGRLTVYGKYIKTLYEAENGVNYSFDTKLENGRGGYFVSGVNTGIAKYYGNADEWLKIEADINGYPVKYIGREAFANEHNDTAHSLVNVLVPETVIAVYDRAFLDNKGLKQVAFCADKVFFGGRADSNNKTSPFYGCYTEISDYTNKLCTVYYNGTQNNPYTHISTTDNKVDGEWNRIYFNKSGTAKTVYYMQIKSGGWSFAEFETVLPADVDLNGIIKNGIQLNVAYGEEGLLANAINSKLPVKEGYYYEVEASGALPLDGKRHFITITVTEQKKVEVETTDIEVVVNFGNDELHSSTVTVKVDAELAAIYNDLAFKTGFNKDEYAFLGWYTDEDLTKPPLSATNNGNIAKLYAKVVKKTVTEANGVIYEFVAATDTLSAHYIVSGFDASKADKDYTDAENWLVLANEVSGIKVTEIKREAFGKKNIKNVVVPCNIKTIGQRAFLDNYGMINAVFLTDNVTMLGSVSGKDFPFYGCSISDGTNQTNLNIYYNGVTPESQWSHFRDGDYYIGVGNAGGSLNEKNTWGYAKFTVTEGYAMADFKYSDGLVKKPIDDDYLNTLKADIITWFNENSAKEGVIYKYSVSVKLEKSEGISYITVAISDNSADAWHKLVLEGNDIQIELTSDIETVNDSFFVRKGAAVTVKPVSGDEGLTRLIAYGDTDKSTVLYDSGEKETVASMTYMMQDKFAYLVAMRNALPITAGTVISLRSAVEVSGFTDKDVDGIYEKSFVVSESKAMPEAVSSSGYTFLGWAYENSSHKLAFETTVNNRVYYAVWAYDRDEIVKDSVEISGDSFGASVTDGAAVSVYDWYAYETVNSVPVFRTAVTPTTLTSATTVVYPRMVFKFTYNMSCNVGGAKYFYAREDTSDSKETKKNGTLSASFNILEGSQLKYFWAYRTESDVDENKVLGVAYVNEAGIEKVLYFRVKYSKYAIGEANTSKVTLSGAITNDEVYNPSNENGPSGIRKAESNLTLDITGIGK